MLTLRLEGEPVRCCLARKVTTLCKSGQDLQSNKGTQLKNRQGGFTLIELAVVIVILGVLAAVVIFAITGGNGSRDYMECKGTTGVYHTWTMDGREDVDHVANDSQCITTTSHVPG